MPTRSEVERAVIQSDLPMRSRLVMLTLAMLPPGSERSIEQIAAAVDMPASTLKTHLDRLEKGGWMTRLRSSGGRGRMSAYTLLVPEKTGPKRSVETGPKRPPAASVRADTQIALTEEHTNPQVATHLEVVDRSVRSSLPQTKPKRPSKPRSPSAKKIYETEDFQLFWKLYPRRVSKAAAAGCFDKAVAEHQRETTYPTAPLETIMAGVRRYAEHVDQGHVEKRFVKHPATWLHQGCWDDEYDDGECETFDSVVTYGPWKPL